MLETTRKDTVIPDNPERTLERSAAAAAAEPAVPVESELPTEAQILLNRFKLEGVIGRGGMGTVYSARDLHMQGQPRVAVKLLSDEFRKNENAVTGLERECRRVRMLAHDAIVRVFEFYNASDQVFITMELLTGEPLDVVIGRHPSGMPFAEGWPMIHAAADALAYAHRQNPPYVHYDFKPKNVFLTSEGRIKVLDFGVARAIKSVGGADRSTRLYETAMPGYMTPSYASCEMLAQVEPDQRDDVYSLACVAYELLAGTHPFDYRDAMTAFTQHLKPKPIPSLSAARNRALAKGLAFERADRTPSVEQFIAELDGPSLRQLPIRRRSAIAAGAAVLIASIAVVAYWKKHPSAGNPPTVIAPQSMSGARVKSLYTLLGIDGPKIDEQQPYPRAGVLSRVRSAPRRVTLGSTQGQIQAAFDLCRHYSTGCTLRMYADETPRNVTLAPFTMDATAVSVSEFRRFVDTTGYRTDAEVTGIAYVQKGATLERVRGGNWRNAVNAGPVSDDLAVVGVSFRDAQTYCSWRQKRLPTEDEWEYAARGPERFMFPWGDDVTVALTHRPARPPVNDGPAQGIAGAFRGLAGNVWQWVDTEIDGAKLLKGGSWLETNPANIRSAVHRIAEIPGTTAFADSASGFRCASSVPAWPDANFWIPSGD